jgi:protein O-GlcNAc transferase
VTRASAQSPLQIAMDHHRAGRLTEAGALYREILAKNTTDAGALFASSVLAQQTGQHEQAVEVLVRAIAVSPEKAVLFVNLGESLRTLKRYGEAAVALQRAISLDAEMPEPIFNLGVLWDELGDATTAGACFARAVDLKPEIPGFQRRLAEALTRAGLLDQAVGHFQCCMVLSPTEWEVPIQLSAVLRALDRARGAIVAARRAAALKPDEARVQTELGRALLADGRLDEALDALRRAVALDPMGKDAHFGSGMALFDSGRPAAAIDAFRRVLEIDPSDAVAHSNVVFIRMFDPTCDAVAAGEEARGWAARFAEPLGSTIEPHVNDRSPKRRLRVGYVSPNFKDHCQALFLTPLLRHHDHAQFEIHCYSSVARPDRITEDTLRCADAWVDIRGSSDEQVARRIREDAVDVLVDLTMHMGEGRLKVFARKPAPVQICWLAYPGTSGISAMDYRITESRLDPPGCDAAYSERSLVLPGSFWCYDPLTVEPAVNPLPARLSGHVTFGCLNAFHKVSESVVELWASVLSRVPRSRMVVLAPEGESRRRCLDVFVRGGVETHRIDFVSRRPRADYLRLYSSIDACLDTLPANGHTTSLDAFWMGVPVVTLVGTTAVGRAGLCQATHLELPELIAKSPAEFRQAAMDLGGDLGRLAALRSGLRERMRGSVLMNAPDFTRNLEAAYRTAWRSWAVEATDRLSVEGLKKA